MDVGNQIKKYRKSLRLSQSELAEKIYVSSQTISNWENERSYPDIHNLIALSALFNVSLDELVKGDVEEMKNVIDQRKMNLYSVLMLVFLFLPLVLLGPALKYYDIYGVGLISILCLVGLIYAHRIDKIKEQYKINTYKEIVVFMETGELHQQKRNKIINYMETIFIVGCFVIVSILIALTSMWIVGLL